MDDTALNKVLEELEELARSQGGCLQALQLRERLSFLGTEEAVAVLRGLKKKNIRFEGLEGKQEEEKEQGKVPGIHPKKASMEERDYAAGILLGMFEEGVLPGSLEDASMGILLLMEEFYCEEILWEDLVQEACLALYGAVGKGAVKREAVLKEMDQELTRVLTDLMGEKQSDAALVEKVEKLEEAVRELNDGEGEKFTIAELAVILDMDVEDIHGILRLTGDDEGQSPE